MLKKKSLTDSKAHAVPGKTIRGARQKSLIMQTDSKYLKLNKSEFLYLVVEDLAPSVSQMITLRLATVHSEEEIDPPSGT